MTLLWSEFLCPSQSSNGRRENAEDTAESVQCAFHQQIMPGEMCHGGEGWRAEVMLAKGHVPGEPPMGI